MRQRDRGRPAYVDDLRRIGSAPHVIAAATRRQTESQAITPNASGILIGPQEDCLPLDDRQDQ